MRLGTIRVVGLPMGLQVESPSEGTGTVGALILLFGILSQLLGMLSRPDQRHRRDDGKTKGGGRSGGCWGDGQLVRRRRARANLIAGIVF